LSFTRTFLNLVRNSGSTRLNSYLNPAIDGPPVHNRPVMYRSPTIHSESATRLRADFGLKISGVAGRGIEESPQVAGHSARLNARI
jgi:hypothetical protein